LMGVEGGGPSTCLGFRCLETTTKSGNKTCWSYIFHNCCNFISTYIFHDALQPFKPWIELKNAHIMCSSMKGHSKS
jgi:hypothetical protein